TPGQDGFSIKARANTQIGVLTLEVQIDRAALYAKSWLTRWTGVPGKMTQLNSVRNRSRTAATATALIVGTTLVAMILTGGRTAQDSTDEMLATKYPVDVYAQLTQIDPTDTAQVASTTQKLADTTGVAGAEALYPVGSIDES